MLCVCDMVKLVEIENQIKFIIFNLRMIIKQLLNYLITLIYILIYGKECYEIFGSLENTMANGYNLR